MSLTFRLATEADALAVGGNLREVDRLEIERGTGNDPRTAPALGIAMSTIAWSANAEWGTVAVFGVAPHKEPGTGIVWLLATPGVDGYAREFLVKGRYYVNLMSRLYPTLINMVDSENAPTRRWLKALGFVEGAALYGRLTGHPFIPITYTRPSHV